MLQKALAISESAISFPARPAWQVKVDLYRTRPQTRFTALV